MGLGEHFQALLSCTKASQYTAATLCSVDNTHTCKSEAIQNPSHMTDTHLMHALSYYLHKP